MKKILLHKTPIISDNKLSFFKPCLNSARTGFKKITNLAKTEFC
ncbi:hypothetical protein MNB_SUP05-SYMBIONT-5-937 [hydrothermal vent metagenome]|uniref:Uncharacterized protein n=1 Tax=hydrothermal vent metagenome TaxID=652676 RepID=A0A1W1E2V8_9ZZZZ